jgi:hypothetical protein
MASVFVLATVTAKVLSKQALRGLDFGCGGHLFNQIEEVGVVSRLTAINSARQ